MSCLDLCEAILADEIISRDLSRIGEITWRDVRSAIVTFIEAGLSKSEDEKPSISIEYLPRVREILIKLSNDPDPSAEDKQSDSYFERDPATGALNQVRAKALGTLVDKYSLYIAKSNQERGLFEGEGPGPNRLETAIEEILTLRLQRGFEQSLAVHSVYGRTLWLLYWLNRTWVRDHITDIFPEEQDPTSIASFVAAWDSYVVFNMPHKELFDFLRPQYVRAIDNLAKGLVTRTHLQPDRGLAAHVLGNYLYGDFDLYSSEGQKSLMVSFFDNAPADTRGSAIWILWNTLKNKVDENDRFWPKAREIWKWRVDKASSKNHSTEFDAEMSWFPYVLEFAPPTESITTMWPLLEGLLPHMGRARRFGSEWEELEKYLLREIEKEPAKVIRFYRLMHEIAGRPAWFRDDHERVLLEIGLRHKESREGTLSLIDLITSMGDLRYRDLYEQRS